MRMRSRFVHFKACEPYIKDLPSSFSNHLDLQLSSIFIRISPPHRLSISSTMTSECKASYVSAVPLDVTWKMVKQADEIMPKAMPSLFAKIDVLEGGGVAGTVRVVTLGEGVGPQAAGNKVKEVIDVLDDATHTISYAIIEGGDPRYKEVRFTVKFSAAGDSTSIDWTVNYTPADDSVPPPEHLKTMAGEANKAMETYAKEHAAEFA